jgi:dimethylaniline monooxygenase (N-oxide forming)
VLVIGTGAASGSDVAQDLIGCAESVTVAVRTERWIARRGYVVGKPTFFMRLLMSLPAWLGTLLALYSDAVPYLSPLDPPGLTDSRDFLTAAALGKIRLRRSVRSVRGDLVAFEDGASGRFDAIVFATGFRRRAPFLPEHLRPERTGLYKHAMSPIAPRLGFCLFVLPFGSHFQVAELQAAWLAETWRGGLATPETREMSCARRRDAPRSRRTRSSQISYRAQYLALLRPALFPLRKETLAGDVLDLARAMVARGMSTRCSSGAGKTPKSGSAATADDAASRDAFFAEASGGDGEDAAEGRDGGEAFRARGWLGGTRWRGVVCV